MSTDETNVEQAEEARLLALAQRATPGPWLKGRWHGFCHLSHPGGLHDGKEPCAYTTELWPAEDAVVAAGGVNLIRETPDCAELRPGDAAYIAAFNPQTTTTLLARLALLREDLAEAKEEAASCRRMMEAWKARALAAEKLWTHSTLAPQSKP